VKWVGPNHAHEAVQVAVFIVNVFERYLFVPRGREVVKTYTSHESKRGRPASAKYGLLRIASMRRCGLMSCTTFLSLSNSQRPLGVNGSETVSLGELFLFFIFFFFFFPISEFTPGFPHPLLDAPGIVLQASPTISA
jgi:hypothetical protein